MGNTFVVVSVVWNPSMRNITNYFITSLAVADLLIIIFCLPATLMNNILTGAAAPIPSPSLWRWVKGREGFVQSGCWVTSCARCRCG